MRPSLLALGLLASTAITAPAFATTTWTGVSEGVTDNDTGEVNTYTVSFTLDDSPAPYGVTSAVTLGGNHPGIPYQYAYYLNVTSFSVSGGSYDITETGGSSFVSTLSSDYIDSGRPGLSLFAGADGTAVGYSLGFIYRPTTPYATTAVPTTLDLAGSVDTNFYLTEYYYEGDPADELINSRDLLNFRFVSGGIVPAAAAAVPEPATWAMMLVGFGGIGFGLRRRAKVTTAVSYS